MRIAIVGCGAVGSFYGARLCRAGLPVHFLLRSDYEAVSRNGVQILSLDGDFQAFPHAARSPDDIGPCDLIVVALKSTANPVLPALLTPLVTSGSWVLTLQNGLGNEEALAALLGPDRILGGLCFVCLNRIAPGIVRHTAHGRIVLGQHLRPPSEGAQTIAQLLRVAGIPCDLTPDLARTHWEKLVWNVPFNGLGVAGVAGYDNVRQGRVPPTLERALSLPTDQLLGDSHWAQLVRELMDEIVAAGRACGFPIDPALPDAMIERTRCMGAYRASTLLDFDHQLPLELEGLFLEPLRRATAAGVSTPRLEALCAVLTELERRRTHAGA